MEVRGWRVGWGAWPQSERCSGSKGTAAGGCQTAMLLAAGSLEGTAECAISMSVTITYCIAKLGTSLKFTASVK